MVAGLSVQVASLLLFMVISLEFGWRAWKHKDQLNQKHATLYHSLRFKLFLCCKLPRTLIFLFPLPTICLKSFKANKDTKPALLVATVTIFTRCVFRVAELSGGFGGHLANDQVSYMILEGVMIVIASICLSVMHPGFGFGREAWKEGDWSFRGMWKEHEGKVGGEKNYEAQVEDQEGIVQNRG